MTFDHDDMYKLAARLNTINKFTNRPDIELLIEQMNAVGDGMAADGVRFEINSHTFSREAYAQARLNFLGGN